VRVKIGTPGGDGVVGYVAGAASGRNGGDISRCATIGDREDNGLGNPVPGPGNARSLSVVLILFCPSALFPTLQNASRPLGGFNLLRDGDPTGKVASEMRTGESVCPSTFGGLTTWAVSKDLR
jgi:hypothetical protein